MSNRVLDELRDMGKTDVLAFATARHETRLQAERELLAAAYRWAVLHNPDSLAPFGRRAADRARPAGAVGTPLITEYAAAAFGARIQTTPYGAKRLIADAVDIHHRLPRLRAGLAAGTVRVGHARHVAAATRDLTDDEAAWVDTEVHRSADGRLGWRRFEVLVEGKVAAAAPAAAAAKERAAALEHGVRMSRVNQHGTATLTVRGDATTIMAIEHATRVRAEELAGTMPEATHGRRQVTALAEAAGVSGRNGPRVKLYLSKVRIQPVIDLNQAIAVDAYEIPARLREAVHLIHPADVFPYAVNTTRAMDLDHHDPYADGGPTSTDNLGPLTRTHHRIKTHDNEGKGWEVRQPFPGITIWRDPHGAHYLVDPTGTRRITATTGDDTPSRAEIGFTQHVVNEWAA